MAEKKVVSDAPESNAGDDFHILWSVRKSLELINFNDTGLKAITLEGIAPSDAALMDPHGDLFLGVDIGEYYGGEDFDSAQQMVFSQLKYSTRHSTTPWTIASVCQGKKSKYSGSIIHRLADIYKAHLGKYSSFEIRDKLLLRLVSNRPFSVAGESLIEEAKQYIRQQASPLTLVKLITELKTSATVDINHLFKASGLTAAEFLGFLCILDFSQCGVKARPLLKAETIYAIAKNNPIGSSQTYDTLHVIVAAKMMPENRSSNKLSIIDILQAFNFSSIEQLFPVPPRFETDQALIIRKQLGEIVNTIKSAKDGPVCIHGGSGIGKTSVSKLIGNFLPTGSVVIRFDGYGGQVYLDSADKRHKPEWASLQIANELALKAGSPFLLLPATLPSESYLRALTERLKIAITIVRESHPDALVVIYMDAADNSVTAAEQNGDHAFVADLVRTAIPDGCRVILTTRTHRISSLQLGSNAKLLGLMPFEETETRERLKLIFPEISDEEVKDFHVLTKGIPRMQTYALVKKELGFKRMLEPLLPSGKTVEDIITQNLNFAFSKLGSVTVAENVLRNLIALPQPVPLTLLSQLSATSDLLIQDLVVDIDQGIVFQNGELSFTDEDFETHLRLSYPATFEVLSAVADHLFAIAEEDDYASRNLGNFLRLTGRYETLKTIVFDRKFLAAHKDIVVQKEVTITRTRQAMKLSLHENNNKDFLKLQIIAAEAAKTNDKLTGVLLNNADLTALYGDTQTVKNLYFKSNELSWYGPVHFRCAAIYSRKKSGYAEAGSHLKEAESWFAWRQRLPNHKWNQYRMTIEDFAFAAEAICRLKDTKTAIDWLFRNSGEHFRPSALLLLINALRVDGSEDVAAAINKLPFRPYSLILMLSCFWKAGKKAPYCADDLISRFSRLMHGRHLLSVPTKIALIPGLEYLAFHGADAGEVNNLMAFIKLKVPGYFPRFHTYLNKSREQILLDAAFRIKSMEAVINGTSLTIEDFYQRAGKANNGPLVYGDRGYEEQSRANTLYKPILDLYLLRAKFICRKINEDELFSGFARYGELAYRDYNYHHYYRELPYYKAYYSAVFCDLLVWVVDKKRFGEILAEAFLTKENEITFRLDLAGVISNAESCDKVTLKLLNEAGDLILNAHTDAGGKISDLLKCIRAAGRLDHSVGEPYFKKMVSMVGEIDLEGFEQIRFIEDLTKMVKGRYPRDAYEFSRFTEYAHSRLKGWDNCMLWRC